MTRIIKTILSVAILGVILYNFSPTLKAQWEGLYRRYFPCQSPITYTLGDFDTRFNISKEQFLQILFEAENVWESAVDKSLFEYEENAERVLEVNLIYDYRQEATVKIRDLGSKVSETRDSYDSLKSDYDELQKEYLEDKREYENRISVYQTKLREYNQKVNDWNKKGGAPSDVYEELEEEKKSLDQELAEIRKIESNINNQVTEINALVGVVNKLAKALNINASELNTIAQKRGEEFTEGEYTVEGSKEEINIYEFGNSAKLKRVLAHEFGHALRLDHVEDPKAIMYYLNESTNDVLTNDDLTALKARCKIK